MTKPGTLTLTKPEEGLRSPEVIDDAKLLGLLDTIDRIQAGETDSVVLSDTIDTFASIIRQILSGEDPTGHYLKYPELSIQEIVAALGNVGTIKLTATEPIAQNQVVYLSSDDSIAPALGDDIDTSLGIGIMVDDPILTGEIGTVFLPGKRVTGILSGATFGDKFFLSNVTPGALTTVPPTSGVLLPVGIALNATDLLVSIGNPVVRS